MKLKCNKKHLVLMAGLSLGVVQHALAAGSAAGDTISNTADVTFDVSGVTQPTKTSAPADFLVDRKVNVTVSRVSAVTVDVAPGALAQVTTFTVKNDSNDTMDFALSVTEPNGDDFDMLNPPKYFVESGVTPGYDPLEDLAVFIDELAPDDSVVVYVVSDIPLASTPVVDGDTGDVNLIATAHIQVDANGQYVNSDVTFAQEQVAANIAPAASVIVTTSADADTANVDTVFADLAGSDDAAEDGAHSALATYQVVTTTVSISKTVSIISDPFNGTTNPKAIPGAILEYCIDVENTGTTVDADSVTIEDILPAETDYVIGVDNFIKIDAAVFGTACGTASLEVKKTEAVDGDSAQLSGGKITGDIGTLTPGDGVRLLFRVFIK